MTRTFIKPSLCIVALAMALTSCIEDGITTAPRDGLEFSTDTLRMGTIITGDVSTTYRLTVRNPNNKGVNISDIHVEGPNSECFRLNVDGFSGTDFHNVEIRANDSIYVLVSGTLPVNHAEAPRPVEAAIAFTMQGASTRRVVLTATGQDVERLYAAEITADTRFRAGKPYQVMDSLIVAPGAKLTIEAGAVLMFHDKAYMSVYGSVESLGTSDQPVEMRGDRTGDVISGITFDLMAGQWNGLYLESGSGPHLFRHTSVRNTRYGVLATDTEATFEHCRLRNSQTTVLDALGSSITATGTEFAEAAEGPVYIAGGTTDFNHCTFANYYLFSAIRGAAINFAHTSVKDALEGYDGPYTAARLTNCILYGLGSDISHGNLDDTDIYLYNCLLKSAGSDDAHFVDCLWDSDPLYYTVREDYVFDYRLRPNSPAIGSGNARWNTTGASQRDAYGLERGKNPDLGAYVYVKE